MMSDQIYHKEERMVEITIGTETAEVAEGLAHFYEIMKLNDCQVVDINQLVYDYVKFISMFSDFKAIQEQENGMNEFEKKVSKHIICHTIKPNTEYCNQQEKRNGKEVLYPVYYFTEDRVHSMAMGGNYPIADCRFFVKSAKGNYIKIK
jgi:hypothetical protein